MGNKTLSTVAIGIAAVLLASGPALAQQKVKIGFITTLSGPQGVVGEYMRNSVELALDHLGRKMAGLDVEVIYGDDQVKPDVGKQVADEMLKKHLRSAEQPKITVNVVYEENETFDVQARILRHMGLLETFAEHAADRYVWPVPFSIEARSCGEANARWRQRTLTLCYELANEFTELFLGYSETWPQEE